MQIEVVSVWEIRRHDQSLANHFTFCSTEMQESFGSLKLTSHIVPNQVMYVDEMPTY